MACIFLKGNLHKVCIAYDDIMILSTDELEKSCNSNAYQLCPIYDRFEKEGNRIPVDQHKSYKLFTK